MARRGERKRTKAGGRSAGESGRGRRSLAWSMAFVVMFALSGALVIWKVRPVAITIGQVTVFLHPEHDPGARLAQHVHEAVHRRQFREHGLVPFLGTYLIDRTQRLAWEAEARAAVLCLTPGLRHSELARLEAWHARGLAYHLPFGSIPPELSLEYIRQAFRQGESCGALLADLPAPRAAYRFSDWAVRLLERLYDLPASRAPSDGHEREDAIPRVDESTAAKWPSARSYARGERRPGNARPIFGTR